MEAQDIFLNILGILGGLLLSIYYMLENLVR